MKTRRKERDRRRIALVPSSYLPHLGGVEEHTRNLARELTERGNAVEIWTVRRDDLPPRGVVEGITVHRLPAPLPALRPVNAGRFLVQYPHAARMWRSTASAFGPDVLHVHCFGPNGAYAARLSARTHVPLVVSLHGETFADDHNVFDESITLRFALRRALGRASVVTGCSQSALNDALERFGQAAQRGVVVPNGIDVGEYPERRLPLAAPDWQRGRYVLALGRLVANKGFDLLIEAFSRVATVYPDVTLVLAGDGPERDRLRGCAAGLDLTRRVVLPGRLDRGAVGQAMAGAEIVVMPSRIEAFGIVVLEAWRAGSPVIASSRGGAPEFVRQGEDGLLVDPLSIADLASALSRLLSSTELRQRLADAGRRRLAEFGWSRVVEQYERVYADVARIAEILGESAVRTAERR